MSRCIGPDKSEETPTPPQGGSGVIVGGQRIAVASLPVMITDNGKVTIVTLPDHVASAEVSGLDVPIVLTAAQRDVASRYVDPFELADFYTIDETDTFCDTSPDDAIARYFDGENKAVSVAVRSYNRKAIDPKWAENMASDCVENIRDFFREDYGGPDLELAREAFPEAIAKKAAQWLVRVCCPASAVWQCENVGKRIYSADEVAKILKANSDE